ncbi:MBL fold metallo-hydrolase [Falsiroseomonas sp. CW058]|uniref:MBL fold metallo-hydrolase n=1 Tax=Falsiroseomonas sp. CW058 TaxID=3388664 RepID=UPI003D31E4EA
MMMDRRTILAAGAAAMAAPRVAAAQGSTQGGNPASHRIAVGGLEAFVVTDGQVARADVTQGVVANATAEQVRGALAAAGIQGTAMPNPFNITIVRTPRGLVALDAGRGAVGGQQAGGVVANMRAIGLDPAQVVLVAHTHFHGDHIGGLVDAAGAPVFPNAEIAVPEREWSFWTDAGEESRAAENRRPNFANVRNRFAPYQAKVTRFAPGTQVAPGITAVASPGHSPGHSSFLVADGSQQLLVIGDAITTPAFFMANPEWYPFFDMDPPMAVETRKRLLDRAATDRIPVVGYHFDMPATGRVERAGSGYRLVPSGA